MHSAPPPLNSNRNVSAAIEALVALGDELPPIAEVEALAIGRCTTRPVLNSGSIQAGPARRSPRLRGPALRTRADKQRQKVAGGIAAAGEQFPGVTVRSPEAAMAANLAAEFERLADEVEAEGVPR